MIEPTKITSQTPKAALPNDTDMLKEMVLTLLGQIDDLEGQLYYLKRQLFGQKSEKLDPAQRMLFEDLYKELQAKAEQQTPKTPSERRKAKANANHQGRRPLPPELDREIIEIEPEQEEKVCSDCNSPKQRIGEEVTEKLDYVPACFKVKRYVRLKYACKQCESNVSIAPLPPMAIDKGIPAEGLLAHIITVRLQVI